MSRYNNSLLIGLLIVISSPLILNASHLIGGKITYRYLGGNKYEYKLTIYRDCSDNIDFDNPAYVSIFDKTTNGLVYNKGLTILNRSVVPIYPPDPCFIPPPGICWEIANYVDTVILNPNNSGYTITYQRCCHNGAITNIAVPQSTGMSITNDIPPQTNNSSQFLNQPPIFICLSDTFYHSFASTDLDGDSLSYQLCTPLTGGSNFNNQPNPASPPPYQPLIWFSGYSSSNPLPNSGGVTLNPFTGLFKFKPNTIGQFAGAICVSEFRNGLLLNTTTFEFQFNVVACFLVSSIPSATNLCEGLTINFQNASTNASAFNWNFGDLSTLSDTSSLFTPTYTFPGYGTYTVTLVATNTNYGFCKDTTKKVIKVNPLLAPTIQPSFSSCFKNNQITFNIGGVYSPSAVFNFYPGLHGNITSQTSNIAICHFDTATVHTLTVLVNQDGCIDTLNATITFTNPVPKVNPEFLNCYGLSPFIGNLSTNSSSYFWDFGLPNITSDTSYQITPQFSYPSYGQYTITLIAYNGICSDTARVPVNIQPRLNLIPDRIVQKQCFKNNSFNFTINGQHGSNPVFKWVLSDSPDSIVYFAQSINNIHFSSPGTHTIKVTLSEYGCSRTSTNLAIVYPTPRPNILLSDTSGCEPMIIKFKSISDGLLPTVNYWTINGDNYTDTTITYSFPQHGIYSFSVIVKDTLTACSDTMARKNFINVNFTPKVNSFVNPAYSSILFPKITFIDSTEGQHHTNYDFGDGQVSQSIVNNYSYQSPGTYNYRLIVYTDYQCGDTAQGSIVIDDIGENYVPNIFTPNNDGINERFFIKGESISQSEMKIFNRWGGLVFETSDALVGWNGIASSSGQPCSDGTYFYVIKITLEGKRKYTFKGPLQLQR